MPKNILLCYYTPGGTSYYHDFAEEFVNNGHSVLHWNLCSAEFSKINSSQILNKITSFQPDLIFSYNNICPEDVIRASRAKILLLDADNPEFFLNKDLINKYDFAYLGYQSNSKRLYKEILKADITNKNYLYFPTATNFTNDSNTTKDIEISFIGSNFYRNFLENYVLNNEELDLILSASKYLKKDYYFHNPLIEKHLLNATKHFLAGQDRLKHLSAIDDLGLQIFSNSDWRRMFFYSIDLANCYNPRIVITKKENQEIYNSSKLSINLSHLQATNSFSWRVPDIMASNSCVVLENKVDWHSIFGSHISELVKNNIIYHDVYDFRQKCINLLKDEDLRLRCVEECQNAINKNGRWKTRLADLESFLGIRLLNNDSVKIPEQILEVLDQSSKDAPNSFENKQLKKLTKSNFQIFLRCILASIYFVPLIGKILMSQKKLKKIIMQISEKIQHN